MKVFLRISFFLSITLLLFSSNTVAMNTYLVGDVVTGQEYNDVLKEWIDRKISIWVGVDESKIEYIAFEGETGLGDATVIFKYDKGKKEKLERLVKKAIKWAEVARNNKADTSKALGCFGYDPNNTCGEWGSAFERNQMSFKFFAANGGQQTTLVIGIIDRDNQFIRTTIYIDSHEMKKLLNNIQGIETALKKARETANKQDIFK